MGFEALATLSILSDIYFLPKFLSQGFASESRLTCCSVFRQTASMKAEIDCSLQSNF
jgi:hypothetical protein